MACDKVIDMMTRANPKDAADMEAILKECLACPEHRLVHAPPACDFGARYTYKLRCLDVPGRIPGGIPLFTVRLG